MALPKLSAQQPIVRPDYLPSTPFLQFMEKARTDQEAIDARQDEAAAAIAQLVADLAQAVADIQAAQETANAAVAAAAAADAKADAADAKAEAAQAEIDDVVTPQMVTISQAVQGAQVANNNTQAQVDDLAGGGAVSGSATNPSVDLLVNGEWVEGPQVNLTGVVAGNLTISGTGPKQDSDVTLFSAPGSVAGEFRVVEIDGGSETVVFTGELVVYQGGPTPPAIVTNMDTEAVSDFVDARTSTGAISYRLDARKNTGPAVTNMSLYLYARRAA